MNSGQAALLEELDAHVTSHSRRTLLEHLKGTHDLLEQWGNPPWVCAAGLFHSIYGTYIFEKKSADLSMRARIREVIGPQAEQLVYIFCVCDRSRFYDHLGESRFRIRDLELDRDTLAALIEIEVANVIEQLPRRSRKKALRVAEFYAPAFKRSRDYLTPMAATAAECCFATLFADSKPLNEAL